MDVNLIFDCEKFGATENCTKVTKTELAEKINTMLSSLNENGAYTISIKIKAEDECNRSGSQGE